MSQYVVTATNLNIRQQPSTNSKVIKVAKQKEVLEVIHFSENRRWAKIQLDDQAIEAWAASSYLEPIKKGNSLLFSLNDFTQKAHRDERTIEQYFVTFIYDPAGDVTQLPLDKSPETSFITGGHQLKQWYLLGITPTFHVTRNYKHTFPGGLPLYEGPLTERTSVYLAVMESDHTERERAAKIFGALTKLLTEPEKDPIMRTVLEVMGVVNPTAKLLEQGFSLAIKAIEAVLINNGDDIDYTNVFTFKESSGFLVGRHSDWGNQRVDLTFDVELL